jgi:soluble lytic murein transglycosylase-like protein
MPRARSTETNRQTAASPYESGSGCLSGFTVIPLTVIVISSVLASLAMKINPTPVVPAPTIMAVSPAPVIQQQQVTLIPTAIPTVMPTEQSIISVLSAIVLTEPTPAPSNLSPSFTPQIQYWGENITRWSAAYGLDPNLAATVMQIESCGDPRARSTSGAMGLFQVMPFHFHATDDPYAPETNAARGLAYLKKSLETANGDARLALAGYNGGIGVISRPEWTWPAETKRYVLFGWPIYSATQSFFGSNEAVQDWYGKYGASLCRQASNRLGLSQ